MELPESSFIPAVLPLRESLCITVFHGDGCREWKTRQFTKPWDSEFVLKCEVMGEYPQQRPWSQATLCYSAGSFLNKTTKIPHEFSCTQDEFITRLTLWESNLFQVPSASPSYSSAVLEALKSLSSCSLARWLSSITHDGTHTQNPGLAKHRSFVPFSRFPQGITFASSCPSCLYLLSCFCPWGRSDCLFPNRPQRVTQMH